MAEGSSPGPASPRRTSQQLVRFLSIESGRSSTTEGRCYEIQPAPQWNYSFKSKVFLIKIAQLVSMTIIYVIVIELQI